MYHKKVPKSHKIYNIVYLDVLLQKAIGVTIDPQLSRCVSIGMCAGES